LIATSAGDFGGYFGLFLGGSAISLFELVDLVIYNALIKLTTRRLRQNGRVQSSSNQPHVIEIQSGVKTPRRSLVDETSLDTVAVEQPRNSTQCFVE
jgi:hypothetical protein